MRNSTTHHLTFAITTAILISSCNSGHNSITPQSTPANQASTLLKNTHDLPLIPNKYLNQQPSWSSCDINNLDLKNQQQIETYKKRIENLGNQLKCTTIEVPLDYANPTKASIHISIAKFYDNYIDKPQAIFFNPGGPGGNGLWQPIAYGNLWSDASPNNPSGKKLLELIKTYNLIGFVPRGVGGGGTELICDYKDTQVKKSKLSNIDKSESNNFIRYQNQKLNAQACQNSDITPYITTENTARDLDLIRQVLGYPKLDYIGYSYGTWLGMWYAGLFPQNVGKMVLDSSMDFQKSMRDGFISQNKQLQLVFDNLVVPYVNNQRNYTLPFDNIKSIFDDAPEMLQRNLGNQLYGLLNNLNQASRLKILNLLTAAYAINQANPLKYSSPYASIDKFINNGYVFHNDPITNDQIKSLANELLNQLYPAIETTTARKFNGTNFAIKCNDEQYPSDFNFWYNLTLKSVEDSPIFGGLFYENCTDKWIRSSTIIKPSISEIIKKTPILMLQSKEDAKTPYLGAFNLNNALDSSHMIVIGDGEYTHGIFPYSSCIDQPVVDYLLTGSLPFGKTSTCANKNNPKPTYRISADNNYLKTYKNRIRAKQLIDDIHQQLNETSGLID